MQAQNVGIGVPNPQSKLTVYGNVAIGTGFNGVAPANGAAVQGPLFVGGTLSNMTSYPDSGAGTYMFFDPINGSLYAGNVTGPSWDGANRGADNAVFGQNNLVSGGYNLVDGAANTVAGNGNVVGFRPIEYVPSKSTRLGCVTLKIVNMQRPKCVCSSEFLVQRKLRQQRASEPGRGL